MKRISVNSIERLNEFLKQNTFWANGKNVEVDHIHPACAGGPRETENIYAIWLTRPEFAWMGLWMGVTSRERLRKRNLSYVRPQTTAGDYIGGIKIFSKDDNLEKLFCDTAYLYLFNPERFRGEIIDCSEVPFAEKIPYLESQGFVKTIMHRKGRDHVTHILPHGRKIVVILDEWQIVLINFENIIPDIEVCLNKGVISELVKRATRTREPVGDNYLPNE